MTDTASLVIKTDATQAASATTTLAELAKQGGVAEAATKGLSLSMNTLVNAAKGLAGAFTLWKAYEYIKDATLLNARYETLGVSMVVVGRNAGYTAEQMEATAQSLQKTGISMNESRSAAMQLVQAHIDLASSSKLARVAQDAAVIGNINSSEAFGRLVHGIQSAQVEVLRTIGINVQFEEGYKNVAAALGKAATDLSDNEKAQSRLAQVMERGKDIAGVYEASMSTAGKQIKSMERYAEDAKVQLGGLFNEALTIGVMAYSDHLKEANGEMTKMGANGSLKEWANGIADAFAIVVDGALGVVSMLQSVGAATNWLGNTIVDGVSRMKHPFSSGEMDLSANNAAFTAMIKDIWANSDKMRVALADRRAALAVDAQKSAETADAKLEQTRADMKAYAKALEDGVLTQEQYARASAAIMKNAYGDNHHYSDSAPTPKKEKKSSAYEGLADSIQKELDLANQELAMTTKLGAADRQRVADLDKVTAAYMNGKITQMQWVKLAGDVETAAAARRDATSHAYIISLQEEGAKLGLTAEQTKMMDAAKQAAANPKYAEQIMAEALAYLQLSSATEQAAAIKADMAAKSEALIAAGASEVQSLDQQIAKQTEANAAVGMSSEQLAELAAKKLELSAASDQELAANMRLALDYAGPLREAYESYADALDKSAAKKRELAGLQTTGAAELAAVNQFKSLWASVDQTAHAVFVNIFQGGQDTFTKLANVLKSTLLDLLYQMTLKKWVFDIVASVTGGAASGAAGAAGSAMAGSAMGGGGGGGVSGLFGFGSSTFALGMEGTIATIAEQGFIGGFSNAMASVSTLAQSGSYMGAFGAAMPYIGAAVAAIAIIQSFTSSSFKDAGGALYANVGSGGASSVANVKYTEQTGRGGTTINGEWSDADAGTTKYIDAGVKAVTAANQAYAAMLGLDAKALENFTAQLAINTTGLDAAAAKTAVDAAIMKFAGDQAASAYGDALAEFGREGENASETMGRLATDLSAVNSWASFFGATMYEVSLVGADAASTLVEAFGGLAKFNSTMSTFYKNFYTKEEQAAKTYEQVQMGLAKNGINMSIADLKGATKAGIRAWIEAAQALTAAGVFTAAQLAAFMEYANAIAPLAPDEAPPPTEPPPPEAPPADSGGGGGGGGGGGSSVGNKGDGSGGAGGWQDSIESWLEKLDSTNNGVADIMRQTQMAWASYSTQLALAKGGDEKAQSDITGYADTYISALRASSSSMVEEQLAIARVKEQMGGLIDKSPTEKIVDAVTRGSQGIISAILTGTDAGSGGGGGALMMGNGKQQDSTAPVVTALQKLQDRLDKIETNTAASAASGRDAATTLDNAAGGARPLMTQAI